MTGPFWALIALAYHVASRLAYVLYVGIALTRQERGGYFTRRYGPDEGFRRFRRAAAAVMTNDGVSFVLLCVVGQNTLPVALPRGFAIALGAALVLVGVGTKLWAAGTLGGGAYYWSNFFTPTASTIPNRAGPYRFLKNPMYTVGYLQLYGLALLTGALFGLGAALFDQAAILVFYRWVERPHFERQGLAPLARAPQNQGSSIRSSDP